MNTTIKLPLTKLVKAHDLQMRTGLDRAAVKQYANAYSQGSAMPAIKAALIRDTYFVLDGWHRLAALELNGDAQADVEVVEGLTMQEATLAALRANLMHGVPLRPRELHIAFRKLIRARGHIKDGKLLSYAGLAEMLGNRVSRMTLQRWMWKDFPRIAEAMSKGEDMDMDDMRGSNTPGPLTLHEKALEKAFLSHLRAAQAAAKAIHEPDRRRRAVARVRRLAKDLEVLHEEPGRIVKLHTSG